MKIQVRESRIDELLTSLKYETYQYGATAPTDDGRLAMLQSIDRVIGSIARQFRQLKPEDRVNVNPFEKNRALDLIQRPPFRTVFFFADSSQPMYPWIADLKRLVRDELHLLAYDDAGPGYHGPEALKYLEAVARGSHCVIDITAKKRSSAFLLGYAFGRDRDHLAVWQRGSDSLITNYRGEASKSEYASKDELWSAVRAFLQA